MGESQMLNSNGSTKGSRRLIVFGLFSIGLVLPLAQAVGPHVSMKSKEEAASDSCSTCVELRVVVAEFIPIAGSDNFIDGFGMVYSHTILKLIEPPEFFGRSLTIEHTVMPETDSIWRSVGCEAFIELSPVGLESPTVIVPAREVTIRKADSESSCENADEPELEEPGVKPGVKQ